jgi:DNA-binding CsgD family transcriptional regulator
MKLSPRLMQVGECLARGYSNKRIASTLKISERTAEQYVARLVEKTVGKGESRYRLISWWMQRAQAGELPEADYEAPDFSEPDLRVTHTITPDTDPSLPPSARCEVCGGRDGLQEHHWAPRAHGRYFRSHKHEWHRAVTPDLFVRGAAAEMFDAARRSIRNKEQDDAA